MRILFKYSLLLAVGALVLSPIIIAIAPDPVPGDFQVDFQNIHFLFPVAYSLGASVVLALFYWVMKR